jgi:glycosyltransferase involved in cell wall biosynthesis
VPLVCGESGCVEIVTAADAGILCDEHTPQALAAAIRDALHLDREKIAHLVANERGWLAGNCDAKRYGAAIARIGWSRLSRKSSGRSNVCTQSK